MANKKKEEVGTKKKPLWKQGPQPKLTAYEKIKNFVVCILITQIECH
jgi:hypothetical protein